MEHVAVREPIGHVLPHDADLAARLREGIQTIHEPLFVLANHLLIFTARRPRHVRVERTTAPRDLAEEAHGR